MYKRLASAVLTCFSLAIQGISYGATLVDTGQPQIDPYLGYGGLTLFSDQSLAGKISLSSPVTLTGVQTVFGDVADGGTYTIALYADKGTLPDTGAELFSTAASLPANYSVDPAWGGVSGLNWQLAAGDYWVSFEVRAGQTLYNFLVGNPAPPNPLSQYAFNYVANGGWLPSLDQPWALRVEGEPAPVPLPGAIWLLGSGLLGLIGLRRFRLKNA